MAAQKTSKNTTKNPAKKTGAKKPTAAAAATKKASGSKTSATLGSKKVASKKKTMKKSPTKKPAAKKPASKAAVSKKPTTKKTNSAPPAASKPASSKKASTTKKPASPKKAPAAAKATDSNATDSKSAGGKSAAPSNDKKSGRKGITVVENRPKRKSPVKQKITPPAGTLGDLLAKRRRQPLIPSGPDAPPSPFGDFAHNAEADGKKKRAKSPFKKKDLDGFRARLMEKRRELVGDVAEMERDMAERGDRGGNPALDVAEQGSDAYDQSLSINLAEADRKLIREIDDALRRIDDGVFGLCEVTNEPIGIERLKELPWARLSIEAARDTERRGLGR
ncbi:MAG: TraR/DksA C4-type zinc finger protein [Planctomycetota bacterium]